MSEFRREITWTILTPQENVSTKSGAWEGIGDVLIHEFHARIDPHHHWLLTFQGISAVWSIISDKTILKLNMQIVRTYFP